MSKRNLWLQSFRIKQSQGPEMDTFRGRVQNKLKRERASLQGQQVHKPPGSLVAEPGNKKL
jgi:hypothetical protein